MCNVIVGCVVCEGYAFFIKNASLRFVQYVLEFCSRRSTCRPVGTRSTASTGRLEPATRPRTWAAPELRSKRTARRMNVTGPSSRERRKIDRSENRIQTCERSGARSRSARRLVSDHSERNRLAPSTRQGSCLPRQARAYIQLDRCILLVLQPFTN